MESRLSVWRRLDQQNYFKHTWLFSLVHFQIFESLKKSQGEIINVRDKGENFRTVVYLTKRLNDLVEKKTTRCDQTREKRMERAASRAPASSRIIESRWGNGWGRDETLCLWNAHRQRPGLTGDWAIREEIRERREGTGREEGRVRLWGLYSVSTPTIESRPSLSSFDAFSLLTIILTPDSLIS